MLERRTRTIQIGTPLHLPGITYGHTVGIVKELNENSSHVEVWILTLDNYGKRNGELMDLRRGTFKKIDVIELAIPIPFSLAPCGHSSQFTKEISTGKLLCLECEYEQNALICELESR